METRTLAPAKKNRTSVTSRPESAVAGLPGRGAEAMNPGDRLLYAISAKREISWPVFKRMFELLCVNGLKQTDLENVKLARHETARGFDALGHLETDFGSNTRGQAGRPVLCLLRGSGFRVA